LLRRWVGCSSLPRGVCPLSSFFQVTNILLILFCAGLFAHGVRSFNEINLIPPVIDPIYNLNSVISENSLLAQILNTLFGYSGNPSLSEAVGYLIYFATLLAGLWLFFRRPVLRVGEP
jgi:high-affinity iron transporter